jgi:hypothetical protein
MSMAVGKPTGSERLSRLLKTPPTGGSRLSSQEVDSRKTNLTHD